MLPLATTVGGFAIDKMMGGDGLTGAGVGFSAGMMGADGGTAAAATTTPSLLTNSAGIASASSGSAALGSGMAAQLGSGTGGLLNATSAGFSGGIPKEAFTGTGEFVDGGVGSGIDFLSNYDAGLPLETGFESGLSEIGSNVGYEAGMPFYNPVDTAFQNQNLITPDMFKQANMTNMANREYLQPLGTEFEPSYLDKIEGLGTGIYDYAAENPDKMLTGGLQIASMLENNQQDISQAARGAGVTPGNIQGLLTPNQVNPMLSSLAPARKKQYRIG